MGILPELLPLFKPLTVLIGPAPLFYLYRAWKSNAASVQRRRQRLPTQASLSILILIILSFVYASLIFFGRSENIFYLTKSRFVAQPSVLQNRLSRIRPQTESDQILLERLATSLSERLSYAVYGPAPLVHCTWCLREHTDAMGSVIVGDDRMYLIFSLPQIISPYLIHAFILGILTTRFLTSAKVSRDLRIYLSYALGLLLAAELWVRATFDTTRNSSANGLSDVIWLHWDLHSFRYTVLTILCLMHAGIVYIVETGCVVLPPAMEDRVFQIGVIAENIAQRMRLSRIVRSVVMRKPEWREKVQRWWDRQRVRERPAVSEEITMKWEAEASGWINSILKIEEEREQ